jgi:hypothetical protein
VDEVNYKGDIEELQEPHLGNTGGDGLGNSVILLEGDYAM